VQLALDRGQRHIHDAEVEDHHERRHQDEAEPQGLPARGVTGRVVHDARGGLAGGRLHCR